MDINNKNQTAKMQTDIKNLQGKLKKIAGLSGMSETEIKAVFSGPTEKAKMLCAEIVNKVPEFTQYSDFVAERTGKLDPYTTFGIFGRFLREKITGSSDNDPILEKAFKFINGSYNDLDDRYVRVMLETEVLEALTLNAKTIAAAKKYLQSTVLEQFRKMI